MKNLRAREMHPYIHPAIWWATAKVRFCTRAPQLRTLNISLICHLFAGTRGKSCYWQCILFLGSPADCEQVSRIPSREELALECANLMLLHRQNEWFRYLRVFRLSKTAGRRNQSSQHLQHLPCERLRQLFEQQSYNHRRCSGLH